MAEESDAGEKTEEPSGRKLIQARTDGMVARSVELSQVLGLSATFVVLQFVAPPLWRKLIAVTTGSFTTDLSSRAFQPNELRLYFLNLVLYLAPEILILLLASAAIGSLSTLLQTNFLWSSKLFKPKWSMLNPVTGLKRIFSMQNKVQLLKSIAKLLIIAPIAYYAFFDYAPVLTRLMAVPLGEYFTITSDFLGHIFWQIMKFMFVLALCDYGWQRYSTKKKLMMSKQEAKDERKSTEGDERTKYAIRSRALQRARQRMMQAVKTADVVVTNPTHISVALKYSMVKGSAPQVVAKGKGLIAKRIRELAAEHGVPVIERKPLARALYAAVEVGHQIPYELYTAVAELFAYVYKLKGRNPIQRRPNEPKPK
jgi:flagellar biosynthetic protein FlhB